MRTKKFLLPEEKLIRLLRERHPDGAKALYDMYRASLFGIICRISKDQALSEDILQETFVRIWQSIEFYEPEKGRLFTWMVNIARNRAIDWLRSKEYRNWQQTDPLDTAEAMVMTDELPFERADRLIIRRGVSKLRVKEYEVIDLVYYHGYTHAEAAAILNLPLGTVKTRLLMAVKRLRSFYGVEPLNLAS